MKANWRGENAVMSWGGVEAAQQDTERARAEGKPLHQEPWRNEGHEGHRTAIMQALTLESQSKASQTETITRNQ